jgi:hypothetical protein
MEVDGDPAGYQSWAEKTAAVYSQYIRAFTRMSVATAKRLTNRSEFGIQNPVVRTVNSVPTVVGTIRITTTMVAPVDATQTEINDSWAFHKNGLANSLVQGQMRDGDYIS